MNDILIYFLKSGIAMALFYLIYRLFMQKETLYSVNRFYLLGTILLSLVIPLLPLENLFIVRERLAVPTFFIDLDQAEMASAVSVASSHGFRIAATDLLRWVYLGGVVVLIAGLLYELTRLILLRRVHEQNYGSMRIIFVKREIIPFSWFNLVFMNSSIRRNPQINTIIHHEYAHYKKLHFMDLIVLEMITIFQWFNPMVWLYVRSIKEIHEYQADASVLKRGQDTGRYQALLVNQVTGTEVFRLANGFSKSLTKKRMIMMTKMKSKRNAWLKALLAMPVLAILLLAYAGKPGTQGEPVTVQGKVIAAEDKTPLPGVHVIVQGTSTGTTTDIEGNFVVTMEEKEGKLVFSFVGFKTVVLPGTAGMMKVELKSTSIQMDPYEVKKDDIATGGEEEVFFAVEDIAHFPGGNPALREYLEKNIRYPGNSKAGAAKVLVSFMIVEDGSVKDAKIMEAASQAMNREALRLINAMPNWEPAAQRGKRVRSNYILPVLFEKQF